MCTCVLVNLCICPQTQWLPDWSEIWVKARSLRFRVLFENYENWCSALFLVKIGIM